MKNTLKTLLCLSLVCALVFSCAFAAEIYSVNYTTGQDKEGNTTVTASTTVNYVEGADDNVKFVTAVYNVADGSLVSVDSAKKVTTPGTNKALANTVTVKDGQIVKSFVWKDSDNAPISLPATYKSDISTEKVNLTINNKSFEEYTGEPLVLTNGVTSQYTKNVSVDADGCIRFPIVQANIKDSSIQVDVKNDEENLKTIITVKSGRAATPWEGDLNYDTTYGTRELYSWESVATVEINYVTDKNEVPASDIVNKGNVSISKADNSTSFNKGYVRDYTNATFEGGYKDISLPMTNMERSVLVVLVPKYTAEDATLESKIARNKATDILVKKNTDNTYSPITWTVDTGVVIDYDYQTDTEGNVIYKYQPELYATYGQMASGVTTLTKDGTTTTVATGAFKGLVSGDGHYVSGSRISSNQAPTTVSNRICFHTVDASLEGCEYILKTWEGSGTNYNATLTFSVNDNLGKILIFSKNDMTSALGISTESAPTLADGSTASLTKDYTLPIPYHMNTDVHTKALTVQQRILTFAKWINDGVIENFSDIYLGSATGSSSQDRFIRYALAGNKPWYEAKADTELATVLSGMTEVNEENVLKVAEMLALEINAKNVNIIKELEFTLKKNYPECAVLEPRVMPFSTESGSMFIDRAGYDERTSINTTNGNDTDVGGLMHYPASLNLDNCVYIASGLSNLIYDQTANNGKPFKNHEPYITITPVYDAEILVFSTAKDAWYTSDEAKEEGWAYTALSRSEEGIAVVERHLDARIAFDKNYALTDKNKNYDIDGDKKISDEEYEEYLKDKNKTYPTMGSAFPYAHMYTKKVESGAKGVVRGVAADLPLIFVRPTTLSDYSAKLASISVAGEEIADFDADTKTYNYVLSDAQAAADYAPVVEATAADCTADIKVTYDKTFPGGAKITVTTPFGEEEVYQVNFICNQDMVYDIVMCDNNVLTYEGKTHNFSTGPIARGTTSAIYLKNGVTVGANGYIDRDTYFIKSVDDKTYEGKDHIIGGIDWYNGNSTLANAFNSATVIPSWLNFKTVRDASVKVCMFNDKASAKLTACGFTKEANTASRFTTNLNADKLRTHGVVYTKFAKGGTTFSVPNAHDNDNTFSVVLFYADWK